MSSVLISHHLTFLWGPLPMLPSNWLSSGPYGTMNSVSVQSNAFAFYTLFVWLMILSKPKKRYTWGNKMCTVIFDKLFVCLAIFAFVGLIIQIL